MNGVNAGAGGTTFTSSTLVNGDVVTCILSSSSSCAVPTTATSSGITMVVNLIPPTPTISVAGTTLTSSSATGNQWYVNGGSISGATANTHVASFTGNYTVKASNAYCTSAESQGTYVTFILTPPTPIITTSGSTHLCTGVSVTLTSSSAYVNFIY